MNYINHLDYYYNEANKICPSRVGERLGILYLDYSPQDTFSIGAEHKAIVETSFTTYQGTAVTFQFQI